MQVISRRASEEGVNEVFALVGYAQMLVERDEVLAETAGEGVHRGIETGGD